MWPRAARSDRPSWRVKIGQGGPAASFGLVLYVRKPFEPGPVGVVGFLGERGSAAGPVGGNTGWVTDHRRHQAGAPVPAVAIVGRYGVAAVSGVRMQSMGLANLLPYD